MQFTFGQRYGKYNSYLEKVYFVLIEVNQRMVGGQGVVKAPLSGEIWKNPSSLSLFLGLEMVQE